MKNIRSTSTAVFCLIILLVLYAANGNACTSTALIAEDGSVVYGRTMEWGAFDLKSRVTIIPRGYEFHGHTPDGKPGLSWKARYGVVGLDALEKDIITDGMNEKGLTVTINAAKSDLPTGARTPISLVVREILQYASNIDEAYAITKKRDIFVIIGIFSPSKIINLRY